MTEYQWTHPRLSFRLRLTFQDIAEISKQRLITAELCEDMRAAADYQLEQAQKELEDFLEEFSCRGHSADTILDLRAFVNNFKNYYRIPQSK